MLRNSKENYNGLFIPDVGQGAGQLIVSGKDTSLKLVSKELWAKPTGEFLDFHGILADGAKASLLECIPKNQINHRWGKSTQHELNVFPHYILVGDTFVGSDESVIRSFHYHFENVHNLVNGFRTFGTMHPDPEEFRKILEADHKKMETALKKYGWEETPFEPEVGENPLLVYYSGRWEIAKCEARIGTVTLTNRISHGIGSSIGEGFDNAITVQFAFDTPKTVSDAVTALSTLHSFFELCLGKQQRILRIEAELETDEPEGSEKREPCSEFFWSYCNEQVSGEVEPTHFGDILIDPGTKQEEFAKILSGWLNSDPDVGAARRRFDSAFHTGHYGIDRIVAAANMFDLLPKTHAPKTIELDPKMLEAVDDCRVRFKSLPDSVERNSVLSALGRVGTASLPAKVRHRADIVIGVGPGKFLELHIPCHQAVLCRNHYVHGSSEAFDYRLEFTSFAFLTETLEFVFAASDLIELGWDYDSWQSKGPSRSHQFGSYMVNYEKNLLRLKALLGKY